MRIGIDMDGVLVDLISKWLEIYNILTEEKVQAKDITSFNVGKHVRFPDTVFAVLDYGLRFDESLSPIPGAIEGVRRLIEDGHEVHIVSSPCVKNRTCESDKKAWVQHHMPFFNLKYFTLTRNKHLYHVDMLLDDRIHNLEAYARHVELGIPVCFDQPWNQEWDGLYRVRGWDEFLDRYQMFF